MGTFIDFQWDGEKIERVFKIVVLWGRGKEKDKEPQSISYNCLLRMN